MYSGIGAPEKALNNLGIDYDLIGFSEIDKYAVKSYCEIHNVNESLNYGDATKIEANLLPDFDLLVGGFPCQAFSVAGYRKGFEDTRGTLFFDLARVAKEKQPKYILLENVKGLISHDKGNTLDLIVETLAGIGYTTDFTVLNSKYFNIPQNRERVFIVAKRNDLTLSESWDISGSNVVAKGRRRISEKETVKTFNFNWPKQTKVSVKLREILVDNVDENVYLSKDKVKKLVSQMNAVDTDVVFVGGINNGSKWLDDGKNYSRNFKQGNRVYCESGIGTALTSQSVGGLGGQTSLYKVSNKTICENEEVLATLTPDRINKRQMGRRFKENDEPSFTVNTQDKHGVAIGEYPDYRIRKLVPMECWRLMGFTDDDFKKAAKVSSNSQLYKQAGNSIVVPVLEAIFKELLKDYIK